MLPTSTATRRTSSAARSPATRSASSGRSSAARRLFLGAELHDMTASDDLWRLSSVEQTLVSVAFKNTLPGLLPPPRRAGVRASCAWAPQRAERDGALGSARAARQRDQLQFLPRRREFRPNLPVVDQHVNAFVLGYTFDTRPLSGAGQSRDLRAAPQGQPVRSWPAGRRRACGSSGPRRSPAGA